MIKAQNSIGELKLPFLLKLLHIGGALCDAVDQQNAWKTKAGPQWKQTVPYITREFVSSKIKTEKTEKQLYANANATRAQNTTIPSSKFQKSRQYDPG